MTIYEYKFFPAPTTARTGNSVELAQDYGRELQSDVNLIAGMGWEYVGREAMPVVRRKWFFFKETFAEDFIIFRRPIAGASLAEFRPHITKVADRARDRVLEKAAAPVGVMPRRVQHIPLPTRPEERRSRIRAAMSVRA